MNPDARELARFIARAGRVAVVTGAGVSTASGIPDYRDRNGEWKHARPVQYADFVAKPEVRQRYWARSFSGWQRIANAQPNRAHTALAALESAGTVDTVITQNVDGLHQQAGNSEERVLELHGNMQWVKCIGCGVRHPSSEVRGWIEAGTEVPDCRRCGGILKPDAVFFGEAMPARETAEAQRRSSSCDLCIVIGSTLVVYPAGLMPQIAVDSGAKLVIINDGETALDHVAHVRIAARASEVMSLTLAKVKEKLGLDT